MADMPTSNSGTPAAGGGGSGLEPNVASLLCYLCTWLTGLIFVLVEKNNKTVRFHAWQAIGFGVAMIAYWFVMTVVAVILSQIAAPLVMLVGLLNLVVYLGAMVVWILLMVKAYQGSSFDLPIIANFARTQAEK